MRRKLLGLQIFKKNVMLLQIYTLSSYDKFIISCLNLFYHFLMLGQKLGEKNTILRGNWRPINFLLKFPDLYYWHEFAYKNNTGPDLVQWHFDKKFFIKMSMDQIFSKRIFVQWLSNNSRSPEGIGKWFSVPISH